MIRFERQTKVRVIYRGGATIDFWAASFERNRTSDEWWWDPRGVQRPVILGPDEIAAVYAIRTRRRLRFGRKK